MLSFKIKQQKQTHKIKNIFTTLVLLVGITAFAQKPIFTTAKVKGVTVYFNSAEISQITSATLPMRDSISLVEKELLKINNAKDSETKTNKFRV